MDNKKRPSVEYGTISVSASHYWQVHSKLFTANWVKHVSSHIQSEFKNRYAVKIISFSPKIEDR